MPYLTKSQCRAITEARANRVSWRKIAEAHGRNVVQLTHDYKRHMRDPGIQCGGIPDEFGALGTRSVTVLLDMGITSIEELRNADPDEVMSQTNMGAKSFSQLRDLAGWPDDKFQRRQAYLHKRADTLRRAGWTVCPPSEDDA
jgi:hypothetical protein